MVDLLSLILFIAHFLFHFAHIDVPFHLLQSGFIQLILLSLFRSVVVSSSHVIFIKGREFPKTIKHVIYDLSCVCFHKYVHT